MIQRILARLRGPAPAFVAASAAVAVVVAVSAAGIWVFRRPAPADGSVWRLLLADRATVGFVRAAIVMIALYAIASTAALATSGRWIKTLTTSGLEADDARAADSTIRELEDRLHAAEQARDEANRLLWRVLHG